MTSEDKLVVQKVKWIFFPDGFAFAKGISAVPMLYVEGSDEFLGIALAFPVVANAYAPTTQMTFLPNLKDREFYGRIPFT